MALGVADWLVALQGDFAGDGLDDAEDGGLALGVGGGVTHVVGTNLIEETGARAVGSCFLDEDFAGTEGYGFDGAVLEVDDAWGEEEEEQDKRHHNVVVEAAALVGPVEVAFEKFEHSVLACVFANDGFAVHVWDEGLGYFDAAVGLLVVFEDCEIGSAYGEAAAVEGVEELGLAGSGWAVADVGSAGLEGLEVGAGADLAVEVLAGEPDFEVVGLGGGETHVAGAEEHAAVGEAELFEDGLGVAGEGLVLFVGLFGRGELDQLDLLELVLTDHAADVFAVAAGFGAEAGGVGAVGDGELGLVEGLVAEEVGDGDFGGGDEPVVVLLQLAGAVGSLVVAVEEVFGELGKLAGAEEGFGIDHVGGQDFGVAMLGCVEVEHEVGEGTLETGSLAVVDDEAGAGDFCGAVEVEDAQGFA